MGLFEKKKRLEELYLRKKCRLKAQPFMDFNKVVKIEVWGAPSAWYWAAQLHFEDGTISPPFPRIRDVEVLKE